MTKIKVFSKDNNYIVRTGNRLISVEGVYRLYNVLTKLFIDNDLEYKSKHPTEILSFSCGAMGRALRELHTTSDKVLPVYFAKEMGYKYIDGMDLGDDSVDIYYNPDKGAIIIGVGGFRKCSCFKINRLTYTNILPTNISVEYKDIFSGAIMIKPDIAISNICALTPEDFEDTIINTTFEYYIRGMKPPVVSISCEAIEFMLNNWHNRQYLFDKLEFSEIFSTDLQRGSYVIVYKSNISDTIIIEIDGYYFVRNLVDKSGEL